MFDLEMADVKPSVLSWLVVGIMAITFIAFAKYAFTKYYIPGLSEVVQSV
jgi:hypothetical protein